MKRFLPLIFAILMVSSLIGCQSSEIVMAEFNLFNYMDMLDEDIHELREKLAAL